jgi:hypothetical protein
VSDDACVRERSRAGHLQSAMSAARAQFAKMESAHGVAAFERDALFAALDVLAREVELASAGAPEHVTEHAVRMSSGAMTVRYDHPDIDRIFPLAEWIRSEQRFGGRVWRRRIIVVDDWEEVSRA